MGLVEIRVDFHIHSCLSPCSDTWRMTPRAIAQKARTVGLGMIAVCDHNSMRNSEAVQKAAEGSSLVVLPGMEITSREEVHILGIFSDLDGAKGMQELVDKSLPGENVPEVFGYQVLMNCEDEIIGSEDRFLAGATTLTVEEIVQAIHLFGGLAIASHVDREAFGILGQLGWIPEGVEFDALEVSWIMSRPEARIKYPQLSGWALVRGSDAHSPEDIGRAWTRVLVGEASWGEIRLALKGLGGRLLV